MTDPGADDHDDLYEAMLAFLKLTLLFHSASPWDDLKRAQWAELQQPILRLETAPLIIAEDRFGLHGFGPQQYLHLDATTRSLCDLGRAILG